MIHFCYDSMTNAELGYPNLAQPGLKPDEFDTTWPQAIPFRLTMYLDRAGIDYASGPVEQAPHGSWYPVAIGWHDFECDYFDLMQAVTVDRLKKQEIRVLFYYHEGDNPQRIQHRMDSVCQQHNLPQDCYLFVSANSAAQQFERTHYFSDHDHFLRYINRRQHYVPVTDTPRAYQFTALNRTHKWWRASCMSDLKSAGLLDHSLWSYNTTCKVNEPVQDNPLEVDTVLGWRENLLNFVAGGPYWCDSADHEQHNDHRFINTDLYTNSYCHIVLETLFDVDQSGGAFITEKTYKCIKYGQPFVIAGGPGSLEALRSAGYRTFDHVIDNSYDTIENNTQRWLAVKRAIAKIHSQDMHTWFTKCLPDLEHNQAVFDQRSSQNLQQLVNRLNYRP